MEALESVRSLQNPTNAPSFNGGFVSINWSLREAKESYGRIDSTGELARLVHENVSPVRQEIDWMRISRLSDPVKHARKAIIFAILSPQTDFAENVIAARQVYDVLNTFSFDRSLIHRDDVLEALYVPHAGTGEIKPINFQLNKADYVWRLIPWLHAITLASIANIMQFEVLCKFKGMGLKTTSMALALYDDTLPVFTLDTWMLRLTASMAGRNPRAKFRTTEPGYRLTEGDWLAWARINCPDLTPFEVQWTVWDLTFGSHVSHVDIFA